jgi:hypothetical protein
MKATKTEISKRVEEVLRIRLDGAQFHDIVQYAAEKGWGLKDRQVRNYIRRADDLLVERQDRNRKRLIARRVAQREALYARALNAADHRTALAVLTDLDRLRGLYPDRDLRELLRLAAEQGRRVEDLECRLRDRSTTDQTPPPSPPAGPPAGPAGDGPPEPRPG